MNIESSGPVQQAAVYKPDLGGNPNSVVPVGLMFWDKWYFLFS